MGKHGQSGLRQLTWTTALPDWEKRIVARQSLIAFDPLFPDQAEIALRIFKELVLVDVAGTPKIGEITRDWVYDFVSAIFGAYNAESGERLIKEFFLLISKKNAKSTISAGVMLAALVLNWRNGAEYFIIAPTKEVANNSFSPAVAMIRSDPRLSDLMQVQEHTRTITHRVTRATLKVLAAESDVVSGIKGTGVLIEELWLFGKRSNAENMLREAKGGLASRPEGFVIYLTTQSDEPPAGVFRQKLQYARDVRDGRITDPQFLPVLYEFPQSMVDNGACRLPENHYITNPNLGASVDTAYLTREFAIAEASGEESLRGFLAKHLNIEIGLALRSDRWAGADFWERQGCLKGFELDDLIARSEVIAIGIDGGGLDDLLGFAAIGRDKETRDWLVWAHAWAHPSVFERRKQIAPLLLDFERDGNLTVVETIGHDVGDIACLVSEIYKSGLLDKVGIDPAGVGSILDAIVNIGVPQESVIGVSQGWKLGGAIKTAERKLAEGGMKHSGSPMMAWCVGNARVEPRGNAILITKQASGMSKIDPLMAMFNAVTLMSLNPQANGRSVYEERGILTV